MSGPLDQLCINTVRFLSVDAVQQANSGHPGLPLGAAAMAYVLWTRLLRHNPRNPDWFDRDRFVLSAGHGSMLLYSLLHLTGYALSLDDIKQFRQGGSKAPEHPERGHTPGVETTTGDHLILTAAEHLQNEGVAVRCVSMPSWELFEAQPQSYRDEVLPPSVPARLAVELGVSQGWYRYVGDRGDMLGIERFGASAPADVLLREYGFTVNNVVARAKALLASISGPPTQPHQEASSDAVRTDAAAR